MTDVEVKIMKTAMDIIHSICDQSQGCGNCPFMKYCNVIGYETPTPDEWEIR